VANHSLAVESLLCKHHNEGEKLQRYGLVIRVKPEAVEKYKAYHARVWLEVLETIRSCNIRNYSIFLKDGYLFAYFEYHGSDYHADMAKMAADPKTREWWSITDPMQQPLETRREGEWWARMEEVFHTD
jgi:L-rhamnose mutarotase